MYKAQPVNVLPLACLSGETCPMKPPNGGLCPIVAGAVIKGVVEIDTAYLPDTRLELATAAAIQLESIDPVRKNAAVRGGTAACRQLVGEYNNSTQDSLLVI
jgi:hypothetical protein